MTGKYCLYSYINQIVYFYTKKLFNKIFFKQQLIYYIMEANFILFFVYCAEHTSRLTKNV